ncbi:MAG: Type II secretion system (T2SS), protein F [Candidatus Fermentimicrarchaeum limneticum]|uniref:Type II secretion system (T2SS), protein F n=1 Tax=Fermentimicrarchaeum limneticum TaxID=2795018 RepID=A0A7D5XJ53_FERL1|nr:MAG: Type II secretion system (T2SS), protein F [Candidatus Fermentimicrarchaeum limneticum]
MKITDKLFISLSLLFPQSFVKNVTKLMTQGGLRMKPRMYLGSAIFWSLFFAVIAFQVSLVFVEAKLAWIAGVVVWMIFVMLADLLLVATADNRAVKIEEVLPDALQTISANVRAGMTTENAIWMGARPEFGPLEEEIKIVSSKCFGGKPISQALKEMGERVKSNTLQRAVKLLVEGIELGGEMAPLLDEVSRDIKSTTALKKEIMNATLMYTIFIVFSSIIAAPVLFASSLYYSEMSLSIMKNRVQMPQDVPVSGGFSMLLSGGGDKANLVNPSEVNLFAIACISMTTTMGALALSQIRYGKVTRGLKLVPIFIVCALSIFFLTHSVFNSAFGYLIR